MLNTINQEIFMHENIHVLNVRVNKFSWVPPQKYFNTKSLSGLKLLYMHCCTIKQPLSRATETVECSQTAASTKQSSIARSTLCIIHCNWR